MIYREHAPHPALSRHVECYWTVRVRMDAGATLEDRVLPDGCMDILFAFGDAPSGAGAGPEPWAVGTMTEAAPVTYAGELALMGVRFRPGGAVPFLRLDASELTDGTAPLDALWGPEALDVWERLALEGTEEARAGLLDRILMDRLDAARSRTDERVLAASEVVARRSGAVSVGELAEAAGLGRRQLERRFLATVGISPKRACRVARLREAVTRLHARPDTPLSTLAYACGYADQAHLTREFTAMAGVSPGAYRKARYGA